MNLMAISWEKLAAYGVPILTTRSPAKLKRTRAGLVRLLKSTCEALENRASKDRIEREREAIQALLLAIEDHYPKFFEAELKKYSAVRRLAPKNITGRLIRLRRQALTVLATYL